jgi:hypothetical protein
MRSPYITSPKRHGSKSLTAISPSSSLSIRNGTDGLLNQSRHKQPARAAKVIGIEQTFQQFLNEQLAVTPFVLEAVAITDRKNRQACLGVQLSQNFLKRVDSRHFSIFR